MATENGNPFFLDFATSRFGKKQKIQKGDLGVILDVLQIHTQDNTADAIKHNVFIKIEVLEVYEDLVEVKIVDVIMSDSANECVVDLVKNGLSKFMTTKNVKWQIK